MNVVWEREPCAAGTVQEALQDIRNWAYSTVKTTMDRMVEKGFLKTTNIRNLQLFSSCVTQTAARRGEVLQTVKRAFDGSLSPLVHFLAETDDLSNEDLEQLRKMVDQKTREREQQS